MYRRYRIPSVMREMNRLQRDLEHLFGDDLYSRRMRPAPGYPAMNIWSGHDNLVITAEVPGVYPEDIDISVVGETLTLSGERKPDQVDEAVRYHRQERGYGKFTRSIQLPYPVDVDKVEATFEKGVLKINLPRVEEDKPKKIAVKTA